MRKVSNWHKNLVKDKNLNPHYAIFGEPSGIDISQFLIKGV